MSGPPIPKDEDNFYHPNCEQDIQDLVKYAKTNGFHVRVRGAGHSMPQAIFTDECSLDLVDVQASAPDGDNINILLDRYNQIFCRKGDLVTVEAGIHLGHDPNDKHSTPENCMLYLINEDYGLAVDSLGGISHQTVAGFLSTGSAGGSLQYSTHENVHALRFVDGYGEIFEVSREDMNLDNFNAALISLGVLGVLSRVTFKCVPKYNISGNQLGTLTHEAKVDIFNDNPTATGKIGLTQFFNQTEYARILWWPQSSKFVDAGKDRVQVWQAERILDSPDFERNPYALFDNTEIMILYSHLMTLIGNIENMEKVREIAASMEDQFKKLAVAELMDEYDMKRPKARRMANLLYFINTFILNLLTDITDMFPVDARNAILPHFSTAAIKLINEIDKNVDFQDHWYLGLPMDNSADDILVPVMWTETWVPLSQATKVTTALCDYFKGLIKSSEAEAAFERTGNNGWELYATKKSDAWLSMAYSDGKDDWKDGAFRVDPYWFIHNSDKFRDMYRPIWQLLKRIGVPFRLHWGKSFPTKDDTEITADFLVTNKYPKLPEFLKLRQQRDPDGIFLNSYWSHWLGINK